MIVDENPGCFVFKFSFLEMRSVAVQYVGVMAANLVMRTQTQSVTRNRDYLTEDTEIEVVEDEVRLINEIEG